MAGAGYDIGASLAASSSATSGNTGAKDFSGNSGTQTNFAGLIALVGALMIGAMVVYFLFKGGK